MALKQDRIQQIENIAWDLLSEAYSGKEIIPPIDVREIAKSMGIEAEFGRFKNEEIDGAFERVSKKIYINSKNSPSRQLFTLSHELGHYILHRDKEQELFYRRDRFWFDDDKETEQEANWFAASLLMPRALIKQYYSLYNSIQDLSYAFMTSSSATSWRLKSLGYKI